MRRNLCFVLIGISISTGVNAHGGGLNADGCHNDRQRGTYHCHGGLGTRPSLRQSAPQPRLPSLLFARPAPIVAFDGRVEAIQKMLKHLGFFVQEADGLMGGQTRKAILAFEEARSLPLTGEASSGLVDALIAAVDE